ncbi:MAG: helix-turn-helix domain-containing protein [Clostridia bacterium]|nr:helix-turn-helix domain-containing protein [Clostridia bacterium]
MAEKFSRQILINNYHPEHHNIHCLYANGANPNVKGDEIHNNYEIIFFISGEAELITEFGQHKLQPNTAIVLPPNTYHKLVINEENELYKRLIIAFFSFTGFDDLVKLKASEFALYQSDELTNLYMQLQKLYDSNFSDVERETLAKAIIAQIFVNFDKSNQKKTKGIQLINPLVEKTVEYIKNHLNEPISVAELAKLHNVSYSCLTSTFKAEMNTSVYNFILSKRLILAAEKLSKGEKPTQVAIECGFNDYSGFYKQYKKMFSKNPASVQKQENFIEHDK